MVSVVTGETAKSGFRGLPVPIGTHRAGRTRPGSLAVTTARGWGRCEGAQWRNPLPLRGCRAPVGPIKSAASRPARLPPDCFSSKSCRPRRGWRVVGRRCGRCWRLVRSRSVALCVASGLESRALPMQMTRVLLQNGLDATGETRTWIVWHMGLPIATGMPNSGARRCQRKGHYSAGGLGECPQGCVLTSPALERVVQFHTDGVSSDQGPIADPSRPRGLFKT